MSFSLSQNHPIAHTTSILISIVSSSIGLRALTAPASFASAWGKSSETKSPLLYVLGGRNLALGVMMLIFSVRGKLRDFGTILMCLPLAAATDAVVTWKFGDRSQVWVHVVPAAILTAFGGWLAWGM